MTEVKHTPGPWRARPWSPKEAQVVAGKPGSETHICGYSLPADARLIAAAPELLEAAVLQEAAEDAREDCECQDDCAWWQCGPCSDRFGHALEVRRAAIIKARGAL